MNKHYPQLQLLVLVLSFTAVLGRLISLPAPDLVFWRTSIAGVIMLAWLAISKRAPIQLARAQQIKACGVGIILGLHWMTFFGSIQLSNISICLAGLASLSLFTSFIEPLAARTRPALSEMLLGIMVIPGIIMVAGASVDHLPGLLCALASAFFAALFTVANRRLTLTGIRPQSLTLYEMLGASVTCWIFLTAENQNILPATPTENDWLWLILLAAVCTVWAFSFHIHLLGKITAFTSNLAMNFEPVYGIILAAIIFKEYRELNVYFYLGAAFILIANIIHAVKNKKSSPLQQTTAI